VRQRERVAPALLPSSFFPAIFLIIFLDEVGNIVVRRLVQTPPAPPGLAKTFGLIIDGLRRAAAVRMAADPSVRPPLLLVHAWLGRLVQRFTALVARAEAGTLRPPRRRVPRPDGSPSKSPPREPQARLPKSFAWLIRVLPYEAACFGSQLQHQFSQPEMIALLEAAPQVGRILRPVCWMLAIELPPALRLPPRPPRPRKPKPPRQSPAERTCDTAPASGRKPKYPPSRGEDGTVYVWRRWRDIWMPEPLRPPKPA
jgi:hypothetical protein